MLIILSLKRNFTKIQFELTFFEDAKCSVGVLVDRGFQKINHMMIIIDKPSDIFLFNIGIDFLLRADTHVTVWDQLKHLQNNKTLNNMITEENNSRITRVENTLIDNTNLIKQELIVVSLENWNNLKKLGTEWLDYCPSILIVNK